MTFLSKTYLDKMAAIPVDEIPAAICEDPSHYTKLLAAYRRSLDDPASRTQDAFLATVSAQILGGILADGVYSIRTTTDRRSLAQRDDVVALAVDLARRIFARIAEDS